MIGYLRGKLIDRRDGALTLDVSGVGYLVFVSVYTFGKTAGMEELSLYIHTHVREQEITLYGFVQKDELQIFELLIAVSGIGPKAALNILSVADVKSIRTAISKKDTSILTKVSGIGKKTAEKVVIELQNKVIAVSDADSAEAVADSDAIDALTSMGYSVAEARTALESVDKELTDVGERVKAALKNLGRG